MSYLTYCNRNVYLIECMNKEDQRLQREKEIWKKEERKEKMSRFPVGRGWRGFVRKIISQSSVLITTCSAWTHCFCFGWKCWDFWSALKSLSRTPGCEKNQWMEREWKASSGLWSSFRENFLQTFSLEPVILLNKTFEWFFWKHFTGIDLSLLLLCGRAENLPDYISPCCLSVPKESS